MIRFAACPLLLLLAGCNPAQVDPPPAPHKEAAKPAAPGPADAGPPGPPGAGTITDDFAAMGQVPCVTRAGWRLRDCTAGLVRRPDGSAVVTIFHPEGRSRDFAFDAAGRATGVATAEQDGSDRQPFSATRRGNVTTVRLGPERYDIPDTLLRGR